MIIKEIAQTEICEAKKLIWKVFLNFEASDYTKEGINTFKNFLDNKEALLKLKMYGAYIDDSLVGVIGTRKNNNHISVFFVYKKYQKQGIGKSLFKIVIQKATKDEVTVNSSPFAV